MCCLYVKDVYDVYLLRSLVVCLLGVGVDGLRLVIRCILLMFFCIMFGMVVGCC